MVASEKYVEALAEIKGARCPLLARADNDNDAVIDAMIEKKYAHAPRIVRRDARKRVWL